MVKEIARPTNEKQWKQELGRIEKALRQKGIKQSPVPTELTKPEHFLNFNGTNALKFDPTGIRLQFAENNREQGGFTGSIWPDQTNPLAFIEAQGDLFEENLRAEALGHIVYGEHAIN